MFSCLGHKGFLIEKSCVHKYLIFFNFYRTFKPMHHQPTSMAPVRHSKNKWVQIDIKEALTKWLIGSIPPTSRKITLAIDAVDSNGNPFREVTVVSSSESDVNTVSSFYMLHILHICSTRLIWYHLCWACVWFSFPHWAQLFFWLIKCLCATYLNKYVCMHKTRSRMHKL